jgi:hypothetical protein
MAVSLKKFDEILAYSKRNKLPAILSGDANAWSSLWHSKKRNLRGDILEEWILENGLNVENMGSAPTWRNYKSKSNIDLTLTTPDMIDKVSNWRSRFGTSSDHATVSFQVKGPEVKGETTLKYTDWDGARQAFRKVKWVPDYSWKSRTVEKEMQAFEKDVNTTIKASTFTRTVKQRVGAARIKDERIDESRAHGASLMEGDEFSDEKRAEIYEHLDQHKKLIKSIRSEKYFEFLDNLIDPKRLPGLTRRAEPAASKVISLVGSTAFRPAKAEESLKILLDAHCPDSTDTPPQLLRNQIKSESLLKDSLINSHT